MLYVTTREIFVGLINLYGILWRFFIGLLHGSDIQQGISKRSE